MSNITAEAPDGEWLARWRVARATAVAASSWILTLPVLARLLHWRRQTATWVQNILGPISGLIWGRIGWVGVRRHGFSTEDAFLAGGLAGVVAPTVELTLRRVGWPPGPEVNPDIRGDRPSLIAYPVAWFWGFVFGGLAATLGAAAARLARD